MLNTTKMLRDYTVVSPSLDGVLTHEELLYEGVHRPVEVLRALDSPANDRKQSAPPYEHKILEQYFYDLYGVFMKKLSSFVLDHSISDNETVKLQAMLQEMVKIKRLIVDR